MCIYVQLYVCVYIEIFWPSFQLRYLAILREWLLVESLLSMETAIRKFVAKAASKQMSATKAAPLPLPPIVRTATGEQLRLDTDIILPSTLLCAHLNSEIYFLFGTKKVLVRIWEIWMTTLQKGATCGLNNSKWRWRCVRGSWCSIFSNLLMTPPLGFVWS